MNGKPPLTFPTPNIPIIGQPVTLKSWFPTAVIVCNCSEAHEPILIVGQAPSICPACSRSYVIGEVTHVLGQPPRIVIGMVTNGTPS